MRVGVNKPLVGKLFAELEDAGHLAFTLIEDPQSDSANELESYIDSIEQDLITLLHMSSEEVDAYRELGRASLKRKEVK
jgi:hypothetical protein